MLSRMKAIWTRIASGSDGRAWLRIALYLAGYSVAIVGVRLFTKLFVSSAISLGLLLLGSFGSVFVGFAIVYIGLLLATRSSGNVETEANEQ